MDNRFLFLGGDRRIIYAALDIARRRSVSALGLSDGFSAPSGKYGAIVLPLPATMDGTLINAPLSAEQLPISLITEYAEEGAVVFSGGSHPALQKLCSDNGLRLRDYFAEETLTLKNAALTAEAAVSLLIQNTEYSLCGANILITGGGRIALHTARLLKSFGADCTICARNAVQRTRAELEYIHSLDISELNALCGEADIILNTVPSQLFSEESFRKLRAGALYMELASKSPEAEKALAAKYGVKHITAGGLPGKFSPITAGEAIAQVILSLV